MIFFTFEFLAFFSFVLALNWTLKPWPRIWRLFLLLASGYFYSVWDWRLLAALAALSVFNYFVGRAVFYNWRGEKKFLLGLGVIGNLQVLAFFKYYDFFRLSLETILKKFGLAYNLPVLELIMAAGISFFLFKMISFLADCYSGKIKEYPAAVDLALYFAFFPQLLSGPIARAGQFLPQLKNGGAKTVDRLHYYVTLIIVGLFKKLLIVNYLTVNITDDVFIVPQNHGSLVVFLAVLAYAVVIYMDLSSYSDMAIGFGGLLGFQTPVNFNAPYGAATIRDFWRKWHITLSDWVRDYIYIPLGGNRRGKLRQGANLVVAMTAMGFWHGAAGHYLFWGFLQGAALSVYAFFPKLQKFAAAGRISRFLSWLATFIFVVLAWIFFRAESVSDGFAVIGRIFAFDRFDESFKLYALAAVVVGFVFLAFEQKIIAGAEWRQKKMPRAIWFVFVAAVMALIFRAGSDTLPAFIYFNF